MSLFSKPDDNQARMYQVEITVNMISHRMIRRGQDSTFVVDGGDEIKRVSQGAHKREVLDEALAAIVLALSAPEEAEKI